MTLKKRGERGTVMRAIEDKCTLSELYKIKDGKVIIHLLTRPTYSSVLGFTSIMSPVLTNGGIIIDTPLES